MSLSKSIICCIVFVTIIKLSSCGIGRMPSPIHPDHPNKCYWQESDTLLSVGSRYRVPNQCAQAVCEPGLSFKITTCAPYGVSSPTCREVEPNIRLPFPRCCLRYECIDRQGRTVLM